MIPIDLPLTGMMAVTLIPLLACSITALALILDACWRMVSVRRLRGRVANQITELTMNGAPKEALAMLFNSRPFFLHAVQTLHAMMDEPKALRDEATSVALSQDIRALTNRRSALVTLAALSPMLGLLGTVVGMMEAFRGLEAHTGPVEPSIVAGGLWQAMLTTGVGLAVAVPCVLTSAGVKSWAEGKTARAGAMLSQISIAIERSRSDGDKHDQS